MYYKYIPTSYHYICMTLLVSSLQIERLAKRLKKENVCVDVVSFGEADDNSDKLSVFVETLNGGKEPKEGKSKSVNGRKEIFLLFYCMFAFRIGGGCGNTCGFLLLLLCTYIRNNH